MLWPEKRPPWDRRGRTHCGLECPLLLLQCGADGASTVRHGKEMCCCWRNFKLGKYWDPSPGSLQRLIIDLALLLYLRVQNPVRILPPLQAQTLPGPVAGSTGGFPAPPERVSVPYCSSRSTGGCRDHKFGDKLYPFPLLLPNSWLLSPDHQSCSSTGVWHAKSHNFKRGKPSSQACLRFPPSVPSPACVLSHVAFALGRAEGSQIR